MPGRVHVVMLLVLLVALSLVAVTPDDARGSAFGPVFGIRELDEAGPQLQGAYLGFRFGPLTPLVGYDRLRASFSLTTEFREVGRSSSSVTSSVTATAHMPWGGLKVLFREPEAGAAVPYLMVAVGKPLLEVELDLSGDVPTDVRQDVEELEDRINRILPSLWVLQGAFGGEYFISDSFAIAAEAGLRYMTASSTVSDSRDYDRDGVTDVIVRNRLTATMDFTFLSLGLTYYF